MADSDEEATALEFHPTSWFAQRVGMSEDWVRRHMHEIPHHRIGRNVRFDEHCIELFRQRTAVMPQDEMRRTPLSRARHRSWDR